MYKKRFYGKSKKNGKRSNYRKKTYRKKTTLLKTIKRVIHQQIENKEWVNYGVNTSCVCATTGVVVPRMFGLLPSIGQNVTQQGRIGNQVRIMKNTFDCHVNLLPYNGTSNPYNPLIVKMWVVSLKNKTQHSLTPSNADLERFFQTGNSSLGFQGNTLDMLFRVNTDCFTVHTVRQFYLGTTIQVGASFPDGTNPPSRHIKIDCSKYVKLLRYNDGDNDVFNKSLWLIIQPVPMDGVSGTSTTPMEIHYTHNVSYEDA